MQEDLPDLAFNYFPGDYRWSHALLLGLNSAPWRGAEIGEIHRIGLRCAEQLGDDAHWFKSWASEAEKAEAAGRERLAEGFKRSAADYLMRASNYYLIGERNLHPKTDASNAAYLRAVQCMKDVAGLIGRPSIEHVEVPYEGTSLPAIYVHAERGPQQGPAPALIVFDGFDVTKETQYFKGIADLAERGIACLLVDGPGNGESIRFRNLTLHHETERYASAVYEYLADREEIDAARIGVMAVSLGGYYASRAAAYEKRLACAIAWGAQWDYHATWVERFRRIDAGDPTAISVPWQHLLWIFGVQTREEALQRLEGFRLDGIVQRIECPFLLLHGEGDKQIPLPLAQKCFDLVGSRQKTLRVFSREEGGYHHCQLDNITIGISFMWDWLESTLQAHR